MDTPDLPDLVEKDLDGFESLDQCGFDGVDPADDDPDDIDVVLMRLSMPPVQLTPAPQLTPTSLAACRPWASSFPGQREIADLSRRLLPTSVVPPVNGGTNLVGGDFEISQSQKNWGKLGLHRFRRLPRV